MAFANNLLAIGTTDTELFVAPPAAEVSVHTLFFDGDDTVTVKLYRKTTGTTQAFLQIPVVSGTPFTFPKPINLQPGDKILASGSSGGGSGLVSAFVDDASGKTASFNPRGDYDPAAAYKRLDVVHGLNGKSYICMPETLTGVAPPSPEWTLLSDTGDDLTVDAIVDNGDGTFTWEFSDATTYTTPNLIGPQGPTGADLMMTNVIDNGNGTFTWEFSDGTVYTTPNLRGSIDTSTAADLSFDSNPVSFSVANVQAAIEELDAKPGGMATSLDGVSNPGGDIDLVASGLLSITPDDANNAITFNVSTPTATAVVFDPSALSLTATTVQGAIAELEGLSGSSTAADTTFDNSTSSLAATDVQAAIIELEGASGSSTAAATTFDDSAVSITAADVQTAIAELDAKPAGPTITSSTSDPSGGSDGDIHFKVV